MRRAALPLALALLAASLPSRPARGGDEAAEAAARLVEKYGEGVESKTPDEVDRHRSALLEPVVASGTAAGFLKVLGLARERASALEGWRNRLREIEEQEKAEAADPDAKKGVDGDTARAMVERLEQRKKDKEKHPARIERETRWQKRLADGAGALLDALPDGDFAKAAAPALKEALGERIEGWDAWMASSVGLSRKERTARLLVESAGEALEAYRKALVARAKPSAELDKINDRLAKRINSGNVTQGDLDALLKDREPLAAEVFRCTSAMETADLRRKAARSALGRMLSGAPEDVRGKVLDLLDKAVFSARDFETRSFGLGALGPCPGDRAMKSLREAAKDPAPDVVVVVLEALGERSEAEALEILAASLADVRWQVRAAAAAGIASYGRALGVPPLIAAMAKAEGRTVEDIHAALTRLTGKRMVAAAAAWDAWWGKEGATFRGPRDPDAPPPVAGGGGDGRRTLESGDGVSFYGIETKSRRILFILDFSGSMNFAGSDTDSAKKKIDVLYAEMKKTLQGLPDGTKFNMLAFSSDVRTWKKSPAVRDAKIAKEAMEWVEKQKVIGSTNIYDALETGFKMMGVGASKDPVYEPVFDTIFFMTDGKPSLGRITDPKLIRGDVQRWNEGRKIRLHVIGMGGKQKGGRGAGGTEDDIDRDFLKRLAEENGGDCVFR